MAYAEEDYLQISGVQHFAFCRRQWALIHIEGQWAENARTVSGAILHERAHDAGLSKKRGDLVTVRGLRVFSATLGISGECDVVEFRRGADAARRSTMSMRCCPLRTVCWQANVPRLRAARAEQRV